MSTTRTLASEAMTLAGLASQIEDEPLDEVRVRLVFEFLRGAQEVDVERAYDLVDDEPPLVGDARFDALMAAMAEDVASTAGKAAPTWATEPGRFLDRAWWVSALPSGRAHALVGAPASYRRRGVMIDRHDLLAA